MELLSMNEPNRILPAVSRVLQRPEGNLQPFARERDERYNHPPPSDTEPGETTQPPTPHPPGPPALDRVQRWHLRHGAHAKSTPLIQFRTQTRHERKRLLSVTCRDRRLSLPWDYSSDIQANCENMVRSRWVQQGIWGDEWGPAWPKGSVPLTPMVNKASGPFAGKYSTCSSKTPIGGRWGHEESDPEPTPEPAEPLFGPFKTNESRGGKTKPLPRRVLRPTVRDREASRPYPQFKYQVSEELQWIKDENESKTTGTCVDFDAIAYQNVKERWIKDGIWRPEWDEFPGPKWIHEDPLEESEGEDDIWDIFAISNDRQEQSQIETYRRGQQPDCRRYPDLFASTAKTTESMNSTNDSELALNSPNTQISEGTMEGNSAPGPSGKASTDGDPTQYPRKAKGLDAHEQTQPELLQSKHKSYPDVQGDEERECLKRQRHPGQDYSPPAANSDDTTDQSRRDHTAGTSPRQCSRTEATAT